jgi:hypothetical protein
MELLIRKNVIWVYEQIRDSIVVSIPACHAGDPGSIPGRGAFFLQQEIQFYFLLENLIYEYFF